MIKEFQNEEVAVAYLIGRGFHPLIRIKNVWHWVSGCFRVTLCYRFKKKSVVLSTFDLVL